MSFLKAWFGVIPPVPDPPIYTSYTTTSDPMETALHILENKDLYSPEVVAAAQEVILKNLSLET